MTPPSWLAHGTAVQGSVAPPVGVSDELARHHLRVHCCPKVDLPYVVDHYQCPADDATARVIRCAACEAVLVFVVPVMCEHVVDLLKEVGT